MTQRGQQPQLPSGTVTFMFTDIDGSTRLWESDPDAMSQSVSRHDAIIASEVEKHGGVLVKKRGEGDSSFSVFSRASSGAHAALAVQTALNE